MNRFWLFAGRIHLLAAVCIPAAYAEQSEKFILETGLGYFSGNYGTTEHTDIRYVPVSAKMQDKDWSLKVTIPYLEIIGTGTVVGSAGQAAVPASTRRVRTGWGDLITSGSMNVFNGGTDGLAVNLAGKIKFATADTSKGLSTGKNDYAVDVTFHKHVDDFTPFGTIGYKVYGSPAAYTMNNVFYGSLGTSYEITQGSNAGAMFMAGQKVLDTRSNRAEFLIFGNHLITRKFRIQGFLLFGLSSSVPDWGSGVLVDYIIDNRKPAQGPASQRYSGA